MLEKLRILSKQDSALSHFAAFGYRLHKHWSIQALAPIIGTVAIGILIGIGSFNVWLLIVCIMYIALIGGDVLCQHYDEFIKIANAESAKSNQFRDVIYRKLAGSQRVLNGIAGRDIYRLARNIKHDSWMSTSMQAKREMYSFQSMCFKVCQEIKSLCESMNPQADYYR